MKKHILGKYTKSNTSPTGGHPTPAGVLLYTDVKRFRGETVKVVKAYSWLLWLTVKLKKFPIIKIKPHQYLVNDSEMIKTVLEKGNIDRAQSSVGKILQEHKIEAALFNQQKGEAKSVRAEIRTYLKLVQLGVGSEGLGSAQFLHNFPIWSDEVIDVVSLAKQLAGFTALKILHPNIDEHFNIHNTFCIKTHNNSTIATKRTSAERNGENVNTGIYECFAEKIDTTVAQEIRSLLPRVPFLSKFAGKNVREVLTEKEIITLVNPDSGLCHHLIQQGVPLGEAFGAVVSTLLASVPTTIASITRSAHMYDALHSSVKTTPPDKNLTRLIINTIAPTSVLPRTLKTELNLNSSTVHHNTHKRDRWKFFPTKSTFGFPQDAELFLAVLNANPTANLAFGYGPTRCVGEEVATHHIMTFLQLLHAHGYVIDKIEPAKFTALPSFQTLTMVKSDTKVNVTDEGS